ncbi:hypothetical protein AAY473_018580, partial [Plecturocebus cupreus]
MVLTHCNLSLPGSSDSPASASPIVRIAGMHHYTRIIFVFLVEMGFHHVSQAGLELLTSRWSAVARSQLTAISTSRVQVILLPQPPKQLGLQAHRQGFIVLARVALNSWPQVIYLPRPPKTSVYRYVLTLKLRKTCLLPSPFTETTLTNDFLTAKINGFICSTYPTALPQSPRLECSGAVLAHCNFHRSSDPPASALQVTGTIVEMEFHHVSKAGLELLTSGDPPASASQNVGVTGVSHCARL